MGILHFLVFQLLSNQVIFLGLVALLGLLLQRKKLPQVIDGVVKTIVGLLVLSAGAGILINAISPVVQELNKSLGVQGVLPTNDAVFGVVLQFATPIRDAVLIFLLAFLLHLVLVRVSPWKDTKNVYLTAHLMLYHAAFMAVTLPHVLHANSVVTIILGTIFNAVYFTFSPAITRKLARSWTKDVQTLGFMDQVGAILAHYLGTWCGSNDPNQDADHLKLPKWASMFRDSTIVLFLLMPIIFLGIGIAVGRDGISTLSGTTNWILWLILQGWQFTAGIVILLSGVRMFIGSIVPAFKGISDKFLPGAVPALDAPTFFPFSPMGGMFGFLGSTVGAIMVTILTIALHSPVIVFPSPIIMYFDGNVMGVFGNKAGGWRGALIAGFVTAVISSTAVIALYPLTGPAFGSGLTWSNIDYALVWTPLMYLLKGIRLVFGF
ncbi:PTS system, ascorbate-specific IIC component [Propionibacterium cyclohexanicum]|uniref:Ascorbate-specific PTS system EIIC component n=1 Tax=Propionibacterium cyclohexanicum TaxID=64702 RepID=A0A1H9QQU9_9ACTN|nr:PTS transporter subunit IIC [Propionibacterium cyclohexanicum]SER62886.1 PTS system, ascorbate-specific IIC component [Propionibacterium cyclohexanicum]